MTRCDGLWAVTLVACALLVVAFTSTLLDQSPALLVAVSVVCWGTIFGGAVALSRRISRRGRPPFR